MSDRLDEFRNPRDGPTEPAIWVAIALSLLIHVAVLWGVPRMRLPALENPEWGDASRSLSVNLVPLDPPPPAPARRAQPSPTFQARPPEAARPRPAPPAVALNQPAPDSPSPAPTVPSVIAPTPARPPAGGDLSSYIEAQRRARATSAPVASRGGESNAPPVEDDKARSDRIIAANLGAQGAPAFGYDPTRKGGAFQIQRVGYNDAEFIFYGWNKEVRRNMAQLIEVQRGSNSDIRIAVVRRIIAIIRDFEGGDFRWESSRQGHNLMLSARLRDNAALEDFMMREFFSEPRLPR